MSEHSAAATLVAQIRRFPETGLAKDAANEIERLQGVVAKMREALADVMRQAESDLKQAHAEICKLQGIDPETHNWPSWSPQAHTPLWFKSIREQFGIDEALSRSGPEDRGTV